MNKKFATAFAAVCIAAALAALASIAYRVVAENAEGKKAAQADFEGLKSVLAGAKVPSDLADPGLRARLAARYEANSALLLVDVYERGSGDRWRIPADSPYLPLVGVKGGASEAPQGATASGYSQAEAAYPPASTILLSAPLKGDSSGRLAVDALYTSLPQASVFRAFRDALIGLGAFLALAAVVLAIVSGSRSRSAAAEGPSEGASEAAAAAAAFQYETLVGEGGTPPSAPLEDEEFDIPVIDAESTTLSGSEGEEGPTMPEIDADFPIATQATTGPSGSAEPAGLYSPASGLGWESYMRERLDAELARSASFEQDLSLLVLTLDGLERGSSAYAQIGKAAQDFFNFRDLSFEQGQDGFTVILPTIDSPRALTMAEDFRAKLAFLGGGDKAELGRLPLFMGISSRAGRLVDSGRLVDEAMAALAKARDEGSEKLRIVAFRPDPDKYRAFLAEKGVGS